MVEDTARQNPRTRLQAYTHRHARIRISRRRNAMMHARCTQRFHGDGCLQCCQSICASWPPCVQSQSRDRQTHVPLTDTCSEASKSVIWLLPMDRQLRSVSLSRPLNLSILFCFSSSIMLHGVWHSACRCVVLHAQILQQA